VLYRGGASSSDAGSTVRSAGGTLVANYRQIGVVIARSSNAGFASAVQKNGKVSGAARTDGFGVKIGDIDTGLDATHPDLAPNVDAADSRRKTAGRAPSGPAGAHGRVSGTLLKTPISSLYSSMPAPFGSRR
jgi:hypothetical protein